MNFRIPESYRDVIVIGENQRDEQKKAGGLGNWVSSRPACHSEETLMLICRPVSRIGHIWRFRNISYILPESTYCFQAHFHYLNLSYVRKMSGAKDRSKAMGMHKKHRTVTAIWRPVSTQSNAYEGHLEEDVKGEVTVDCHASDIGSQVSKLQHAEAATCSSDIHNSNINTELISEKDGSSAPSSSGLQCSDQPEVADEKTSMISANIVVENLSQSQDVAVEITSSETAAIHPDQVEENSGTGKLSIPIEVNSSLIRFIKGKRGSTQMQIEKETGVKIIFPSSREDTSVVIEGASIENVTKASEKIQTVLDEAINSPKLDYSHFISLPLANHPELVEKLTNFQNSLVGNPESIEDVNGDSDSNEDNSDDGEDEDRKADGSLSVAVNLKVQDDNDHVNVSITKMVPTNYPPKSKASSVSDLGIDRSIFIKPKTFHLTVLMLKLWNKERVAAATGVLQSISSKVKDALDGRPISITLKGLVCMKGSLAKARVLYAPVEEIGGEDRLLSACQVIIDAYIEAGLVLEKDIHQKLKLHATLMNTRHRKRKKRTRRHDCFDARGIFKKYGSEEWGEYLIPEAHLSQRFVFDDKGYYHCCASIPFPEDTQVD